MRLATVRVLICFAMVLLAGCGEPATPSQAGTDGRAAGPGDTGALVQVILQTDWYPQPEHAGFYLASLAGWYREAGLDVEIRPGANAGGIPQLVATGRVEFAIGTGDNLFVAQSRGIPLVGLFPYFQHDPQCVMFHPSSGVRTLADLDGRRVMVNPGGAHVAWLQHSLGIRLQLIPLDFSLARFLADPEFVQQCFVTSEPWYVAQKGVTPGVLPLSSSGFDPYRLVYANAAYVAANPEVVRAFIAASLRGWQAYADGDAERVHARIAELNPGQSMPYMAWTREQMAAHGLIHGDPARGEALGRISRTRLADLGGQLQQIGLMPAPPDLDESFAFHLLPDGLVTE